MEYRTCTYIHDDGGICKSAAVTDRNLCLYHLSHRARLMRMAQYRARGERFDLQLPPLESMFAVQSALTQLSEALAADMIELKRADRLIRVLNIASRNLLKADKWPASPYHSDQPAPAVDLAADYGLPNDLDLDIRPEVAFPSPAEPAFSICHPERRLPLRQPESKDLLSPRPIPPSSATGSFLRPGPMPTVGLLHSTVPAVPITSSAPTTPLLPSRSRSCEISQTHGSDAAARRGKSTGSATVSAAQPPNRKRYAAIALEKNMRLAAERLADQKLAERAAAQKVAPEPIETRKPPASTIQESAAATEQEALSIA